MGEGYSHECFGFGCYGQLCKIDSDIKDVLKGSLIDSKSYFDALGSKGCKSGFRIALGAMQSMGHRSSHTKS